jgi:hypothetical protein
VSSARAKVVPIRSNYLEGIMELERRLEDLWHDQESVDRLKAVDHNSAERLDAVRVQKASGIARCLDEYGCRAVGDWSFDFVTMRVVKRETG